MTSNCWLPLERIGEQKAEAFCEAVNCERSEQEGKFLFCDAGFSPWFHLRVPAQFSQPCMATSGLVKRGERWYHFMIHYNVKHLKDPMEGLNHISPRYWTTSSAHV